MLVALSPWVTSMSFLNTANGMTECLTLNAGADLLVSGVPFSADEGVQEKLKMHGYLSKRESRSVVQAGAGSCVAEGYFGNNGSRYGWG